MAPEGTAWASSLHQTSPPQQPLPPRRDGEHFLLLVAQQKACDWWQGLHHDWCKHEDPSFAWGAATLVLYTHTHTHTHTHLFSLHKAAQLTLWAAGRHPLVPSSPKTAMLDPSKDFSQVICIAYFWFLSFVDSWGGNVKKRNSGRNSDSNKVARVAARLASSPCYQQEQHQDLQWQIRLAVM
jgi:hypothetical protein